MVLGDYSEPQPDFSAESQRRLLPFISPKPADVLLLVEVVDTTGQYDREIKIPLYARYGIPEVWLVDVTKNRLERYRAPQPEPGSYQRAETYYDEEVSPWAYPRSGD